MAVVFTGTGCCIPTQIVGDEYFVNNTFFNERKEPIQEPNERILKKFRQITGIRERRYAAPDQVTSDLGTEAAQAAIQDAGIQGDELFAIIFAHNYGDIKTGTNQSDTVPSLAARVKHNLNIYNPTCIVFDVIAGCPGWVQAVMVAESMIKANRQRKILVIGGEMLSRVTDPHDRDSMIYSDGAGAVVMEYRDSDAGIAYISGKSFTGEELSYLNFDFSQNIAFPQKRRFIKMKGRKIYEFALSVVPDAMRECLENSGYSIDDLDKILIHQANQKMDDAILKRFYQLYGKKENAEEIMPMTIEKLGNSSVATIPTLLDLIRKNKLPGHRLSPGNIILIASVGAGMNVNALVYKVGG